ncbi:hypothetical protein NHN26_10085 [Rhodovulum tesquicola]|uniref:hypothetical protein n=1 Tax=Rhodovulum tesquicola TaxID=540254 RepID=UPI00209742CF|nr:hypothetical protein [Rhodovulum tesquicola]MCO8145574.1 hypothetical protein [Rhodovulum tesquicola]
MAAPLKNAIRLIVAIGGFAARPDLLGGLKAGVEIHDLARGMLARMPPGLKTMADDLTAEAEAIFGAMAHELPPDAPILFEQMVEIALPDPQQIVADGMDAERIVATMLARLTQIEHTRAPMPDLFRAIVTPAFARLLESPSFADDLTPAFMAGVLGDLDRIEGKIDNLGARLEDIEAQSREALNAMALRFGEPAPEDMSLPALQDFLTKKARDYRALKAEVEAIPDGLKRLSNLKAAARGAIEAGDLDEVETLLSLVQEVELDEAAKTAELRADNALLRGRAEQAFTILSAAADSFAAIDPRAPPRRRINFAGRLYQHGCAMAG